MRRGTLSGTRREDVRPFPDEIDAAGETCRTMSTEARGRDLDCAKISRGAAERGHFRRSASRGREVLDNLIELIGGHGAAKRETNGGLCNLC